MHFLFSTALKDLWRIRNDIWKPIIWAGIPLVIAALITMAMGGSSGAQPTVQLLVADEDDSFLSNFLAGSFGQGEAGQLFHVEKISSAKGRDRLSEGEASALLIIPKGFGEAVLNDSPCQLLLITNPAQRILPGIAEETISILVDGSFYAHRILGDEIRQIADGIQDSNNGLSDGEIAKTSVRINQVMQRVTKYTSPLAITLESSVDEKKDEEKKAKSKADDIPLSFYFFPGTLLMALFFMAEGLSSDLWAERDRGTLRRVSTTPHGMASFLGGKFVASAIVIFLVSLVLLSIGCLYFKRPFSVLPLALFWMTVSGTVLLSVLSLLQLLATSQRAGALISNSLMFPLLMIGGSFFPFEAMPPWMAAIGRFTPNGWMLVQMKAIMLQETEVGSFAVATAALVVVFVVFFGCCTIRLSAVRARG